MTESGIYGVTGVEPEAGYQENGWSDLSTDLRQKMDCFHRSFKARQYSSENYSRYAYSYVRGNALEDQLRLCQSS
ncbi:uncharacterized protein BO96DRAFT_253230 [Aspergillus niger CBS 101883]|uniref:uncharacterized protein n=1 Tax=Aspergillus lacticoffeatus (strain CBS 101883) TaxID=1450533 RepID=UPI000D7F1060|nr:uncharacterized protein BO96DRAFT_253230 [Aspergillus niger CBS 101883]PYH58050.1 hypothetical protein BO96DRAFT_253230 [Aspergillus niger CBS 101883]